MVRAPCCEKMGMKKGPWTPEEDQILVSYIQRHGHGNWRALPKHAGLMRCGKSCRLRWINYLRPDIKRGNFSNEEEESIVKLHQVLGNRWSAIAARLPGRTDNEIKNYWHSHLKKKLQQDYLATPNGSSNTRTQNRAIMSNISRLSQPARFIIQETSPSPANYTPDLPQHSSSPSPALVSTGTSENDHMEFWYDLLLKTEVPNNSGQFG